jgi:nucleoside 2-deoxyribosyltransferase
MAKDDPSPRALKIYFAGSIRGGRGDADLYAELIRYLERYGRVLTEHVGDAALLADERTLTEAAIFDRDMEWLRAADFVLAEVSTPSLGVGFEIGLAQTLGKEIFCLYRECEGRRLSAMIAGNPALTVCPYLDLEDAKRVVDRIIRQTGSG